MYIGQGYGLQAVDTQGYKHELHDDVVVALLSEHVQHQED